MSSDQSTCWMLIEGAAKGDPDEREAFARRYAPAVHAYLTARWRGSPLEGEADDATQEVFVECFRSALERVSRQSEGSFRGYLYGIARNVARRFEERRAKRRDQPRASILAHVDGKEREAALSLVFDKSWARSLLQEARRRQAAEAARRGEDALRRVDILRLRFVDGKPIREIANTWGADAAQLHREYAKARKEFKAALMAVVGEHHPGTQAEVEQECVHLLAILK